MIRKVLTKILGDPNVREVKRARAVVAKVNAFEDDMKKLSDEELKGVTDKLKERLAKDEPLDGLLPEAFAAVREAAVRVVGMRHFDVQLIGGTVLHSGKIAEMRTGEGK